MKPHYRLAAFISHPIHYLLGWFRQLALQPEIDLMVYLACDYGLHPMLDPTSGVTVHWYDRSVLDGVPYKILRQSTELPGGFTGNFTPTLWRELQRNSYDALIVRGYATLNSYWAFLAAAATRTPVIFHAETNLQAATTGVKQKIKSLVVKSLLSRSTACLPIGTDSYRFYKHYGVPAEKLFLAPYAVDNEYLFTQLTYWRPQRAALRRALGIMDEKPVILYVGKLTPRKRPLDLLWAFARFQENAHLVIVGDGILMDEMRQLVAEQALTQVHFAGFQQQTVLPQYYALADIFVFPSEYEPWGLVLNEAMCSELPVIVSDGIVARYDLVRPAENGFVYPAGDVSALRDHLKRLISSAEMRREMGLRSKEIITKWSYAEDVQATLQAVQSVYHRRNGSKVETGA
jgi:glycosyltransferase involved in cell wall biosynthesis